jgi:hypothetical protein
VIEFTPQDIDTPFWTSNRHILQQKRGGGYWLWKPWAANKAAALLTDGDFLVYLDSGCYILKSIEPWLRLAATQDPGWVVLEIDEYVPRWTKGDLFAALKLDPSAFTSTKQVLGGVWAMRVSPLTKSILRQWLQLAQNEDLLTDKPSKTENPPGFVEHRHDQSIFSLLIRTHNVTTLLRDNTFPHDAALRAGALVSTARSRD